MIKKNDIVIYKCFLSRCSGKVVECDSRSITLHNGIKILVFEVVNVLHPADSRYNFYNEKCKGDAYGR